MEIYEHLSAYQKFLSRRRISRSLMNTYLREAGRVLKYLGDREISIKIIDSYVEDIQKNYKVTTLNLYLTALNHYMVFIRHEECRVKLRRVQQNRSLENILEIKEYWRLLHCARERGNLKAYLTMRTLAATGIRIGELCGITVSALMIGKAELWNKGKYREVFLPDSLITELKDYCYKNKIAEGAVFLGNRGQPISRSGVWQMLQNIAVQAGISKEKAHPHSFRHFFAKTYIQKFGDLSELADILGHSNIEVTRIYTRTTVQEKRERLEEMGL